MDSDFRDALALLEARAGDPRNGLPYDLFLFISRMVPMVNVDLFIRDDRGRVLLTWRDDDIHGAGWHVPGGMIRFKETAADRIRQTAQEELGAVVTYTPVPVVEQLINPQRSTRGHHIALVYNCRLTSNPDEKLAYRDGAPSRGQWAWHDQWPRDILPAHRGYDRFLSMGW